MENLPRTRKDAKRPRASEARKILFLFAVIGVLAVAACERQSSPAPAPATLQKHWSIPDFALTERTGETVRRDDLKGKVWVADFFYTSCPGPCPMMSSRLSEVQNVLGAEPDLRLVSISLDPAKDTPEVLKLYAQKFGANERWLFLTGQKEAIYELGNKGFKLSAVEQPGAAEPIIHSTKLVLVDRTGTVRGFYEGANLEGIQALLRDLPRLLAEPP